MSMLRQGRGRRWERGMSGIKEGRGGEERGRYCAGEKLTVTDDFT